MPECLSWLCWPEYLFIAKNNVYRKWCRYFYLLFWIYVFGLWLFLLSSAKQQQQKIEIIWLNFTYHLHLSIHQCRHIWYQNYNLCKWKTHKKKLFDFFEIRYFGNSNFNKQKILNLNLETPLDFVGLMFNLCMYKCRYISLTKLWQFWKDSFNLV